MLSRWPETTHTTCVRYSRHRLSPLTEIPTRWEARLDRASLRRTLQTVPPRHLTFPQATRTCRSAQIATDSTFDSLMSPMHPTAMATTATVPTKSSSIPRPCPSFLLATLCAFRCRSGTPYSVCVFLLCITKGEITLSRLLARGFESTTSEFWGAAVQEGERRETEVGFDTSRESRNPFR